MVGTWRRKDTVLVPRHHHSPALPTFRKPHFFANVFRCTTRVTRAHSSGLHQSQPRPPALCIMSHLLLVGKAFGRERLADVLASLTKASCLRLLAASRRPPFRATPFFSGHGQSRSFRGSKSQSSKPAQP